MHAIAQTESETLRGDLQLNLKRRIDEQRELFEQTGHLYGLASLPLSESDPPRFDVFQWRLISAVNAARETSKHVSGSPAAVGMSELCDLIALPEGDVIACSFGLAGHIGAFPVIIRSLAELGYEENPGIKDGDIWGANDPMYGGPHQADNYSFLPVFYDGQLICWVASANHITDTGHAISAGGVPAYSSNSYGDGLTYGPEKIGERVGNTYVTYKTHLNRYRRLTRTGSLNILDDKMRVTGIVMLRERVLKIIDEFGVEYWNQALREILERERRDIAHRLQRWSVPGHYRQACFRPINYRGFMGRVFPQSDKDWVVHLNQFIRLRPNGTCDVDHNGSTSQDYFWLNGYEGSVQMGATYSNAGFLMRTPMANTSLFYAVNYIRPEGSLMNPTRDDVSASFGNALGTILGAMSSRCWGFSHFLKGYLEEAFILESDWNIYGEEGRFKNGISWAMGNFSCIGSEPRGPSSWRDGEALVIGGGNPESDFGEAEEWEYVEPPLLTLSRGLIPDYCAHGRQRGSIGIALSHLVCHPEYLSMNCTGFSGSLMGAMGVGVCGGYPGLNGAVAYFHDTNANDLIERRETLPTNIVDAFRMLEEGKLKAGEVEFYNGHESPPVVLKHGDLVFHAQHAGSAWGDPIERKLELIVKDIEDGCISPEVARDVYGAVVCQANGGWVYDQEKTADARTQIRKNRLARAVPAKDFYLQERRRLVEGRIAPQSVCEMYRDSDKYHLWRSEFRGFWQLDEDFQL